MLVERWPRSVWEEVHSHQRNGYLPQPPAGRHRSTNMCVCVTWISNGKDSDSSHLFPCMTTLSADISRNVHVPRLIYGRNKAN